MSTNGGKDDEDEERLLKGRWYNLISEILGGLNKVTPSIERVSRIAYDHSQTVETRLEYVISELRVMKSDQATALADFIAKVDRERRDLIDQIIAIRTATALAADNAGDAKNAAIATREATGPQKLYDKDKDTPESAKGVSGAVVKGLGVWGKMGARAQVLLILLAMVVSAAVTAVAYERLQRPSESSQHQQRHFEGPKKD